MAALIPSNEIKLILAAGGKNAKKLRCILEQHRDLMSIEQLLDQSDGHADQVCEDILQEFKLNGKYPD